MKQWRAPTTGTARKGWNAAGDGTVGVFKACAISQLDFNVAEDYKRSCPIFCSTASQNNFNGKVWCAGRVKHSDRIITGKRVDSTQ